MRPPREAGASGAGQVHLAAERAAAELGGKKIEFEHAPAFAPELNPVEAMRSHAKHADLDNFVPGDAVELGHAVNALLDD